MTALGQAIGPHVGVLLYQALDAGERIGFVARVLQNTPISPDFIGSQVAGVRYLGQIFARLPRQAVSGRGDPVSDIV